jgi:N utilization substance protein B
VGTRRKSRELAMQMLFQGDLGKQQPKEVEGLFWEAHDAVPAETRGFAEELYRAVSERSEEVDALIQKNSSNWRIERMPVVDRSLLRAAVGEMLAFPRTPLAVIINESLELARLYAAPESMKFLNGVLDSVGHELLKEKLAKKKPRAAKSGPGTETPPPLL